jgi:UDP-N-acetylglucosamine--N-acetylmuramyl-(pentapeptide) pyrophosphoryl-undecaprenol N-acetylglucosamine transferase
MKHFLISCGGTGGHLAPGIALAEGLAARGHGTTLLVSAKAVDARLRAKYPALKFETVPAAPFASDPAGLVRFVWQQWRGLRFCRRLIRATRPAAVVGFGGFTSGAVVVAGWLRGVPVALHEANRVPGRATRLLSRLARRVYLPPGVALSGLGDAARRHAALPVRREIVRLPRAEACARLGLDPSRKVLVVLGGSQGATALNGWARHELPAFAAAGVQLCCVTGPGKGADGAENVSLPDAAGLPVAAVFLSFSDDMAALLSAADLVVSRAGAGTIAELARCATPAILVPYPESADKHQQANAEFFAQQGGGLVLDQAELSRLGLLARELVADDARLARFRAGLRNQDRPGALGLILDDLESLNSSLPSAAAMQSTLA